MRLPLRFAARRQTPRATAHHRLVNACRLNQFNFTRTLATVTAMALTEYKLKLDKLDFKDGDKVEAHVEGVEGGKVLLLQVHGELRAMGSKCTHYGAPLVKGVVMDDERITCPWHGACFDTRTGEVNDAPALNYLNTYKVEKKSGAIYILADEASLKGGSRAPELGCSAISPGKEDEKVIVVGGGSGAIGVIEGIKEKGYKSKVIVLSKEAYLPIDRTKLSKALIKDASKIQVRTEEQYNSAGVEFHLETEVVSVDFEGHKVRTRDGKDWGYSKVVFATGGNARRLPMQGFKTLGNVFVLRGIDDVGRILAAVGDNKKKIVIVGSSFIGMEVGKCLSGKDNDVTIVGMESAPLERVMGHKIGQIFQKQLENSGVKFRMSAQVDDAKPSASNSSNVGSVALKSGEHLEADLVVLGVGVAPATEYLRDSGVKLENDGSVLVDDHWRIKGVSDAYAVGDIATYPHGEGVVRIEHWNVAQNAGRQAGLHISHKRKPVPFTPIFWSALGSQLRYCGHSGGADKHDDMLVMNNPKQEGGWVAYYTKGEKVVAVASMNYDPIVSQSAELMRRGAMPTKSQLAAGLTPLAIYPPATIVA